MVEGVHLVGIDPDAVMRLRILQGNRQVYNLTGYRDTRGRMVSAGALIASMAWLESRQGMSIRTMSMSLTLSEMTVEVQAIINAPTGMDAALRVELAR